MTAEEQTPQLQHDDEWEHVSELRQDLVTGDWIVVATGRAKRPSTFVAEERERFQQPKSECPFEDPQASGNGDPVLVLYGDDHPPNMPRDDGSYDKWTLQVINNKFPAFGHGRCSVEDTAGPYTIRDGAGFHEVVITRDHERSIARLPQERVEEVVRAYLERYRVLEQDDCVRYVSIFHNHGKEAGASIAHPHSQIIAIPVLPTTVRWSLLGSERYYFEHERECVYCTMIAFEQQEKERIIFENDHFLVVAPFVPETAFEMRIYPKEHASHFNTLTEEQVGPLASALRHALGMLYHALGDPSYNFFIHTAPTHDGRFDHYHWHVEILPKTQVWAGFELGTGIEISTIRPRDAAAFLRQHNEDI